MPLKNADRVQFQKRISEMVVGEEGFATLDSLIFGKDMKVYLDTGKFYREHAGKPFRLYLKRASADKNGYEVDAASVYGKMSKEEVVKRGHRWPVAGLEDLEHIKYHIEDDLVEIDKLNPKVFITNGQHKTSEEEGNKLPEKA